MKKKLLLRNKIMNFESISQQIQKGGEISPFLLLGENLELLHSQLLYFLQKLLREYGIDQQSLFHLADDGEALKIQSVKQSLSAGEMRPRFAFQVFVIENIARMTPQAANACLKFFEEPGDGNIVILTNTSTSGILETILSRVQIISFSETTSHPNPLLPGEGTTSFYYSMIESHVNKTSDELVRYFFSGKYEKQEYVEFLKSLIPFFHSSLHLSPASRESFFTELEEDIGGILKNNLQGRYVVDKWIMRLES